MHPLVVPEEFAARLSRLRARALQRITDRRQRAVEDREADPGDSIDQSVQESSTTYLRSFSHREYDRIEAIEDAMYRLDRGTYGHCLECGDLIDIHRLQIAPDTPHCLECAEMVAEERARRGEQRLL